MGKLIFQDSYGEERVLVRGIQYCDVPFHINAFLVDHDFKSYYTREMELDNGRIMIDVGSHTEFFFYEPVE